ncbi:MAG TPA: universal stress protein [Gemmatimonadaceae bacterium]|jgi:Universal stress protein UspA and related nucleotide-binding proteins
MRPDRVVVGMDFSQPAEEAARWAARHFAPGAEIVLVHVVAVPEPPRFFRGKFPPRETVIETARAGADRRMRDLSTSLGAERIWMEIREGDPAEQIDAVATEYDADVVVVGPHGARPGIWDRPGGTAEKLVREAKHAVLLAANPSDRAPRRLLVPVDDSSSTATVLAWARLLAERSGTELTLLHIVSSTMLNELLSAGAVISGVMVPVPDEVLTNAEMDAGSWLQQVASEAGLDRPGVSTLVKAGDPADEILAAAERLDADLIVMGSSAHGLRAALLGSVAREVIRSAKRPVLVTREMSQEAGGREQQESTDRTA